MYPWLYNASHIFQPDVRHLQGKKIREFSKIKAVYQTNKENKLFRFPLKEQVTFKELLYMPSEHEN